MKRAFAIVVSYWDGSGIIRAFRPYDTEQAAQNAQPTLQELYEGGSNGKWEVIPMFTIATEQQPPYDWGVDAIEIPSGPTPGCDCGLPGMGFGWHTDTCAWKKAVRASRQAARPVDQ